MIVINRRFAFFIAGTFALIGSAHQSDTIRVSEFGVKPNTFENCVTGLQRAIESCRSNPGSVLLFETGRYDIWPEGAVRKEIYISNTSSEVECPSKIKTIGLHFDKLENIIVEGAGATLMMHGSITPVAIDSCSGVEIKNLTVDFERPAASELTYVKCEPGLVVMKAHPDTRYQIIDGHIRLIGEGWQSQKIHCIKYSPGDKHSTYSHDWNVLQACHATEVSPGLISFRVPEDFKPVIGTTLTLRDIIRSQVGTLILESENVKFRDVNMRFMHGLGIVSQYSRNITMERVNCAPSIESGRLLASSADFMHFSGCSGAVNVLDCNFAGSHDDAINVHGTNLRIVEKLSDNELRLQFMHHQTYGLNAFHPGDTVSFVNPATMLRSHFSVVKNVSKVNPRIMTITLDKQVPADIEIGKTCVENMTCTPTVYIAGCSFTRHSTRGILMTTPRKVVIENNRFSHLGMAAILIEGDAEGWYESGPVQDVTIKDNEFIDCGFNGATSGATIALNPSNTIINPKYPVHENVNIIGNRFNTFGRPVLFAKSTGKLTIDKNTVEGNYTPLFILNGCSDVRISDNFMKTPEIKQSDSLRIKFSK